MQSQTVVVPGQAIQVAQQAGQQAGAQAVVDIVIVISDLVSQICQLRLKRRLFLFQETRPDVA